MTVSPTMSLQEAVAREQIRNLIRERNRLRPRILRRHARTALVLRRLAERLDPGPDPVPAPWRAGAGSQSGGIRPVAAC